jgi:hypothetical protein
MFLPLIMLNMLIAIMSDTYARVMSEIVPSDFFELNQMIVEVEKLFFWRRQQGKPQFLHFAYYVEQQEQEEWEGQIQGLMKKIEEKNSDNPQLFK